MTMGHTNPFLAMSREVRRTFYAEFFTSAVSAHRRNISKVAVEKFEKPGTYSQKNVFFSIERRVVK